ncbi:uncharacterized protein [Drosophila tropicalis]
MRMRNSNSDVELPKETSKGNRKSGVARLPTRRPDPNVYNRNALLARENRRKKKAYLEAVEKELEETRITNKSLFKALKKQSKMCRKLQKENQLLKITLGNQKTPISSFRCVSPVGSLGSFSHYSSSGSSTFEPDSAHPQKEESVNNNNNNDYQPTSAYDNTWNEILNENCFQFVDKESPSAEEDTDNDICGINDDHSYFKGCLSSAPNDSTELCLHITSGRISSLDVDAISPQWSASGTPPVQLLQDDDVMDDDTTTAWIKKLFGKMRWIVILITCMVPKFTKRWVFVFILRIKTAIAQCLFERDSHSCCPTFSVATNTCGDPKIS